MDSNALAFGLSPFVSASLIAELSSQSTGQECPCYDDVRTLTAARLVADGIRADLICGGFPCQDISVAGKGAGMAGARSGLWREFARLIGEVRPRYALVENVSALRTRGLGDVLGDLAALGYDCTWHCIGAAHIGAPHIRDRIWIVAHAQRDELRDEPRRRNGPRGPDTSEFGDNGAEGNVADATSSRHQSGQPGASGKIRHEARRQEPERLGGDVADTDRGRREGEWLAEHSAVEGSPGGEPDRCGASGRRHGPTLGHSGGEGRSHAESSSTDAAPPGRRVPSPASPWESEPTMGELVNGISGRLVRFDGRTASDVPERVAKLRALGNSLVPQIPEMIGRAIMRREGMR